MSLWQPVVDSNCACASVTYPAFRGKTVIVAPKILVEITLNDY